MKKKIIRYVSVFMILNLVFEITSPTVALALTNGPVQPEFLGFEAANSSEMVDLFTGDFKYNIPLMDVDGYPLNLSYKAGTNMESEASWVGLGWSMNPGVLNRMMKGLPDDFNGDEVHSEMNMKPLNSMGIGPSESTYLGVGFSISYQGIPLLNLGGGVGASNAYAMVYNNYKGFGIEKTNDSHYSFSAGNVLASMNGSTGHDVTYSSQNGGSFGDSYSTGIGVMIDKFSFSYSNGQGTNYNTRNGAITNSVNQDASVVPDGSHGYGFAYSYSLPAGAISYAPKISFDTYGGGASKSYRVGFWSRTGTIGFSFSFGALVGVKGFYNTMSAVNTTQDLPSYGYLYAQNYNSGSLMDFNRFRDGAIYEQTPNASFASSTYDLFFASAQGMSSTFRPFREDIIMPQDPMYVTGSNSTYSGLEIAPGILIHALKESSSITTNGLSYTWKTQLYNSFPSASYTDVISPSVSNFSTVAKQAFVEHTYFKEMGEMTARDADYETSLLTDQLVAPALVNAGADYVALSPIASCIRKQRDKRAKHIECLTATQADQYGVERQISLYTQNSFSLNTSTRLVSAATYTVDRKFKTLSTTSYSFSNKPVYDHISEVSVTNSFGSRYIYGIPAYNLFKKTVAFNASARTEGAYVSNGTSYTSFSNLAYSVQALPSSDPCQFVNYNPLDVTNNKRGLDNFMKLEETPAYASSYLLTSVLSSDYVDVSGNGPSYDDLGSFTKFNYSKGNDYQWREPYCLDAAISGTAMAGGLSTSTAQANFDKGLICDELDDKAEYQYGVRESYYLHSIESKNYVAVFRTSNRSDGLGVLDEYGSKNSGGSGDLLELDQIDLYSKNELLQNGSNAVPIKSVHFVYDYSLCPYAFNTLATNNATHGKLTLKKVYFTYGSSNKSSLSPYEFTYADNSHSSPGAQNFAYSPRSVDRWGTFKPNNNAAVGNTVSLNNVEFPYAEQNQQLADSAAAAWNLTQIKTPSGATIKITYESDDYAYVQNQPAAQMCKIYNCVPSIISNTVDVVATLGNPTTCNIKDNPQVIIDLSHMNAGISTSLSLSDATAYAQNVLFSGAQDNAASNSGYKPLYFKNFLKVAGPECGAGITQNYYEFINGYATIETAGLFSAANANNTYTVINSAGTGTTSCYRFAYVSLKSKMAYQTVAGYTSAKYTSPFCMAGWDFLRHYASRIAYPGSEPANMGGALASPLSMLVNAVAGIGVAKIDLENGKLGDPNKRFYDQDFSSTLYPAKSFVRVYSAHYKKLGGGHRVKQILTQDNWDSMTSGINTSLYHENPTVYGQTFEYTTQHAVTGEIISSGVSSYEPLTGGDENSMRQPIPFEVDNTFAPNDHFFQDAPLGEMMYPAPLVGYSKVTIRTIPDPSVNNVTGFGKTEFEFYTAKDFPITDITDEARKATIDQTPPDATLSTFIDRLDNPKYVVRKIFHMTQGNLLKFNDMHGKLRSIAVFGQDNADVPVIKTEYFYKSQDGDLFKELVTAVPTIDETNTITPKTVIARDIDVTPDARENLIETDVTGKSNLFELGLMIIPIPSPPYIDIEPDIPTIRHEVLRGATTFGFRGATITKVVQEYGILEKVESIYNGSKTITENLLWDANTGNVVLTRVRNELDQPVYHFNYPGYWAYKEMAPEFTRDGIGLFCAHPSSGLSVTKPLDVSSGTFSYSAVNNPVVFEPGDEVMVTDVTNTATPVRIGDRFWFVNNPAGGTYNLVDRQGNLMSVANYSTLSTSSDYVIRMIKPINKNNLNTSIGYVTSLSSPQNTLNNTIDFTMSSQKIIDAGTQQYCSGGSVYTDPLLATSSVQSGVNVPPGSYSLATINPVIAEGYGTMRPTHAYKYKTSRSYGTQPDRKADGLYPTSGTNTFTPFWFYESGNPYMVCITTSNCTRTSPGDAYGSWTPFDKHAYYSPYGDLLQLDNAIGVTSAQRYGFNHTLPVLQANNARSNEVGFESFEEYARVYPYLTVGTNTSSVFNNDHLGFYSQISSTVGAQPVYTTTTAHTGKYSLSYGSSQTVDLKFATQGTYQRQGVSVSKTDCGCRSQNQEINGVKLDLDYTKTYIASMWVKGNTQALDYSNLVSFSVTQSYSTSSVANATTTLVKSAVINGWQKLDYEITLSSAPGSTPYTLDIKISSGSSGGFYLDDFRIQPFNSTMTCRVYDPFQLRVSAELDDRNYATIYEYDQEGVLVRQKKETLNALYTVQEVRTGKTKR